MKKHVTTLSIPKILLIIMMPITFAGCGHPPLHKAVMRGNVSQTQTLLDAGADVNVYSRGRQALWHAVEKGNTDIVQRLISAGAEVNVNGGGTSWGSLLGMAVTNGDADIVRILIDAGVDVNAPYRVLIKEEEKKTSRKRKDIQGSVYFDPIGGLLFQKRPLQIAIEKGHDSIVQMLIEAGADVNSRDLIE